MPSPCSKNRFLLLYGSETGQAQAIAEEINEAAPHQGLAPEMHCLSSTDKKFSIEKESCVVLVVSTTGEGDPPETAQKFWRRLKKRTLPSDYLEKLNYTLLALGDSNYTNFCDNGKKFDKRLETLGGKRFYPTAYADDAVGLEVVVEPWLEGLWSALNNQLGLSGIDREVKKLKLENHDVEGSTEVTPENFAPGRGEIVTKDGRAPQPGDEKDTGGGTEPVQKPDRNGVLKRDNSDVSSMSQVDEDLASSPDLHENGEIPNKKCLTRSSPPLCNDALTLPLNPPPFLEIVFHEDQKSVTSEPHLQNGHPFPSAASHITIATVTRATRLTSEDAERKTLELELRLSEALDYQPGDSFGVICPNRAEEVNGLLIRLGADEKSDIPLTLKLEEGTRKRRAAVPEFVPPQSTLRQALTHCYNIRNPPKKVFVRVLSEHTADPQEKRRLQELCSKEGAPDYNQYIRRGNLSLIDILNAFPTCLPPVERILEHLTRLLPRPYSVASSPLCDPQQVCFAFNVLQFPETEIKPAQSGLCSGWLDSITSFLRDNSSDNGQESAELSAEKPKIPVYFRTNTTFRLPEDTTRPVIMIGPGTGVAPFVGFMEHRQLMMRDRPEENDGTYGMMWLFFGCRHQNKDYLYRERINSFMEAGILSKLSVSFSRHTNNNDSDDDHTRYVQDSMRLHKQQLAELVMEKEAVVFVCGDADGMAKDVMAAWTEILCEHTGKTAFEVKVLMATLREEGRYLQDVWT